MSKFDLLKKLISPKTEAEALQLLEQVATPEIATALKGADKQAYMNALDMVHGPRAQRAKDMGFGAKQNFYHGTNAENIQAFDPKLANASNTLGPGRDLGSFFSSNPEISSLYAGQNGNVMPVKIKRRGTSAMELEGGEFNFSDVDNARMLLDGQPNVTLKGDKGVPSDYEKDLVGDTVIVKDPSSVRSVNAAFDPRFKNSGNILAGAAGLTGAGLAMAPTDDAQASMKFDALKKLINPKTEAEALQLLEQVATPEISTALKGADKEAYLNALDMVQGPRIQRAKDEGFDFTKRYYHGSPNKPFDSFDSNKLGSTSEHQSSQLGTWVTPQKSVAENYTYKDGIKTDDGHIRELVGRFENPDTVDFRDISAETEYLPTEDIENYLGPRKNIDALTIKGSPGETMYTNPEGLSNVTLVRNPERLRDVNANFDKRFTDSGNLMAGAAGVAGAGAVLAGSDAMASDKDPRKLALQNIQQFQAEREAEGDALRKALTGSDYKPKNPLEVFQSAVVAPGRAALQEAQMGRYSQMGSAYKNQFMQDPEKAPSWKQIGQNMGLSDKPLSSFPMTEKLYRDPKAPIELGDEAAIEEVDGTGRPIVHNWKPEKGGPLDASPAGFYGGVAEEFADPLNWVPAAPVMGGVEKVAQKTAQKAPGLFPKLAGKIK